MTKHYPKSRTTINQQQQDQQSKPKEKGWYCISHSIKYRCDICGYDDNKRKEGKYYFVNDQQ